MAKNSYPGDAAPGTVVGEDGQTRPTWAAHDPLLRRYYDEEWGVPVEDERGMFEALSLEAFQSGLSWATILRKREAFRRAFAGFDPEVVAAFGEADVARLKRDEGIVRNELKIRATVANARATLALRAEGGLPELVWSFAPPKGRAAAIAPLGRSAESEALAKALRSRGFKFVGPTTMHALMQAVGVLGERHARGSSDGSASTASGAAGGNDRQ